MDFTGGANNISGARTGSNGMNNNNRPLLPHGGETHVLDPSAMTGAIPQHPQHPVQVQQPQTTRPVDQAGLLYDLSSFDPLQAHALQLSASAGLASLLPPVPTAGAPQHIGLATGAITHSQLPLHHQQPLVAQQQIQRAPPQQVAPSLQHIPHQPQSQQNPYYYLQAQPGGAATSLQPIAPATQQVIAPGMVSQNPGMGQVPQSFILPAAAQATALAVPPNFQSQIFPHTITTVAASPPGVIPSLLMGHPFQGMVANAVQPPQHSPLVPAIAKKRGAADALGLDQPAKKKRELAPSVVSSSIVSTETIGYFSKGAATLGPSGEMPTASPAQLAKMTPAERRRYDRNLREQQRSFRISQQIKELRDVLTDSNVPFKPNKYSILLSVVEYIKQLQARAIMLDAEHQKLITTIRQTNEMVNSGNTPSSADETEATNTTTPSDSGSDNEMLFVQGLDYQSVFVQCPAALGIAALDGRILECNPEFQGLLGFKREELCKQSLFNLVRNHQDIFRAMAEMLKCAEEPGHSADGSPPGKNRFWSGPVISKRDNKMSMNLTLTVGGDGSPKFFNCALTTK